MSDTRILRFILFPLVRAPSVFDHAIAPRARMGRRCGRFQKWEENYRETKKKWNEPENLALEAQRGKDRPRLRFVVRPVEFPGSFFICLLRDAA